MFKILKNFFDFCNAEDRKRFYVSIVLSLLQAMFEALKIPAIACMLKALLDDNVTSKTCITCLCIMLISIIGAGIAKSKATMLQTEGGYKQSRTYHVGNNKYNAESRKCCHKSGHARLLGTAFNCGNYRYAALFRLAYRADPLRRTCSILCDKQRNDEGICKYG